MLRWRNRVPAGHTAPLDPGERETSQIRRALASGRGIPVHQGMDATYLSLLPVEGPESGKKKKMKTKYNFSSCKAERRGGGGGGGGITMFCRNIRQRVELKKKKKKGAFADEAPWLCY